MSTDEFPECYINYMDNKEASMKGSHFDARFPEQNQTAYCFTSYVDYHRCKNLKGQNYSPCEYFKNVYTAVCPMSWVSKWDQWVDEKRFPANLEY